MTTEDLTPFVVKAIDLAPLNGDLSAEVTFVGTTLGGARFSDRVTLRTGWKHYVLPNSYSYLQKLEWQQGDCIGNKPHIFDDLVAYEYR
jgi:hypothetical protein